MRGGVAEPGAQGEEQRQRPARGRSGPGAQLHGASHSPPATSVRLSARPAALPAPSLTQIPPHPVSALRGGSAPLRPRRRSLHPRPAGPGRPRSPPAPRRSPLPGRGGARKQAEGRTPAPRGAGRHQRGPRSPFLRGNPGDRLGEGPRGNGCPEPRARGSPSGGADVGVGSWRCIPGRCGGLLPCLALLSRSR